MGAASDPAFASDYLAAHKLPSAAWVYAYILWILVAAAVALVAAASFVPPRRKPALAARFRRRFAACHVPSLWRSPPAPLLSLAAPAALWAAVLCLVLIGTDYPDPARPAWSDARHVLRPTWHVPPGTPPVTTTAPHTALTYRTWWTASDRLGLLLNALVPLVVLLAVRQTPLAILSIRALGGFAFDSLARLHGHAAWLVWGLATAHTVTWFIQLARDRTPTGDRALRAAIRVPRFRWAIVSYVFLTLMCLLSVPPVRRRHYEVFYVSHVVCGIGFLVAGALHHPPLAPWLWAALALWMADRTLLLLFKLWFNFPAASLPHTVSLGGEKVGVAGYMNHGTSKPSTPVQLVDYTNPVTAAGQPGEPERVALTPLASSPTIPRAHTSSPLSSVVDLDSLPGKQPRRPRARSLSPGRALHYPPSYDSHPQTRTLTPTPMLMSITPRPNDPFQPLSHALAARVVPGYAFAQLLPGHLVRLTLRLPRPQPWFPGQWLSLALPQVSAWQSHPFTIASAVEARAAPDDALADSSQDGRTAVLLIRARRGFTRRLYEHVARLRAQAHPHPHAQHAQPPPAPGVHLRALAEGPYGSAARVPFGAYSTVVVVCAGSGVAYGSAVLQFLCAGMLHTQAKARAQHQSAGAGSGSGARPAAVFAPSARHLALPPAPRWHTSRVHFVWIMRDLAHLVWAARAIRRCIEAVPPSMLTVDLFVTQPCDAHHVTAAATATTDTAAWVPGHASASSGDTVGADCGADAGADAEVDVEAAAAEPAPACAHAQKATEDGGGLTEFEGEPDEPSPTDVRLTAALHVEGALRRARTFTATVKRVKRRQHDTQRSVPRPSRRRALSGNASVLLSPFLGPVVRNNDSPLSSHAACPVVQGSGLGWAPDDPPLPSEANANANTSPGCHRHHGNTDAIALDAARQAQAAIYDGAAGQPLAGSTSTPHPLQHPSAQFGFGFENERESGGFASGRSTPLLKPHAMPPTPSPSLKAFDRSMSRLRLDCEGGTGIGTDYGTGAGAGMAGASTAELGIDLDLDAGEEGDARVVAELVRTGRPDLSMLISTAAAHGDDKGGGSASPTLVAACGPPALAEDVRRAAAAANDPNEGKHVVAEVESFGW